MFEIIPFSGRRGYMNPFAEFERMFDAGSSVAMKTDVFDTGEGYRIEAELPGFNKEDIKLDLNEDRLTITAERKAESETKNDGCIRRERSYGSFSRSFDISGIDRSAISAAYKDGILTVNLPKQPEIVPESRRISID